TYRFKKRCAPVEHPVVEAPFWFSDTPSDHTSRYVDDASLDGFRSRFHQLLYGEVETTDRMGKMLAEFPDLPWEMRMELAHQMWDEARHIEIVAKAVEDELGGTLGYGPWSLVWWWMQNDPDPLKRITVTNSWAEANLMHTLREWRTQAERRGFTRIAELCDYLQADELTHVKLATNWLRRFTDDDPARREELLSYGRKAVARIQSFHSDTPYSEGDEATDARFSFVRSQPGEPALSGAATNIIGE
ncbi:MAG: ferritin-like domain-containing protein, partial [Chloroflexota bacterium]|nr:ferritin-like domain-containing protein [Chloroflexota bacterium]